LYFNGHTTGVCIGKYNGKDALYMVVQSYSFNCPNIFIYEINSHLSPIMHYRLYRADSEENTVMLADEFTGASFIDSTWNNANAGVYRFGISEIYFNGIESEIIWSNTIVKTTDGIQENNDDQKESTDPSIQKVFEDGHIVIIKDGIRYSISGQKLN
jgi:hypothetical protein